MATNIAGVSRSNGVNATINDVGAPLKNINKKLVNEAEDNNLDSVVSSTSSSLYFGIEPLQTSTPIGSHAQAAGAAAAKNNLHREIIAKTLKKKNLNFDDNFTKVSGGIVLDFKQFPSTTLTSHSKYEQNPSAGHTIVNRYKGESLLVVDKRLLACLITFGILIIAYKMVLVAVPYANTDAVSDLSFYVQNKFNEGFNSFYNSLNSKDIKEFGSSIITPLICGLLVSLVSFLMVYLDSSVPGVNPPSPFSPKSKQMYYRHRSSTLHLGYITAITSGLVVSALMYFER